MSKPKILLADDHPGVYDTVAGLLEGEFEVIGCVGDGWALVEAATKLNPDVIITDISMPVLNGIEAANKLKEFGSTSQIVFLTVHDDPDFVNACVATGARGYVSKRRMALDLVPAIHEALNGRMFVSVNI